MALDETNEPVADDAVMPVFSAAMSLPERERAEFVEKACAGDSVLLAEVLSRIESEARLNGFLLTPLLRAIDSTDHSTLPTSSFTASVLLGSLAKAVWAWCTRPRMKG